MHYERKKGNKFSTTVSQYTYLLLESKNGATTFRSAY